MDKSYSLYKWKAYGEKYQEKITPEVYQVIFHPEGLRVTNLLKITAKIHIYEEGGEIIVSIPSLGTASYLTDITIRDFSQKCFAVIGRDKYNYIHIYIIDFSKG